ncbi:MAG TPA: hypothetical protein EYM49_07855 [Campylobacterales bacterium]|nr:hypothetical protein [Campylobacterales bacterium]
MKRVLLISTIFAITSLFSDSVIISDERPTFQKRHTFNKTIKSEKPNKQSSSYHRKFKRDHHRYDKRYSSFNYDRDSYYDNEGYYYGYYDNSGYFFNNIFFEYNAQYSYHDRLYLRGYFQPHHKHRRVYRYHTVNNWNRVHCYREPNVIVSGYYYNSPSYYNGSRYNNQRHYQRDQGRVSHGRFSDNNSRRDYREAERRRDNFRSDYRNNYSNFNSRRGEYRSNSHRRDNGSLSRGRFSDKSNQRSSNRSYNRNSNHSNNKNRGHLQISK